MLAKALKFDIRDTRKEILVLLLASAACVGLVAAGLVKSLGLDGLSHGLFSHLPIAALAVLPLIAAALAWRSARRARVGLRPFTAEAGETRRRLAAASALVAAEPQILILWEKDCPLRLVAHSLASVPGVPSALADILRFGQWLEPASAKALRAALDALFSEGTPFAAVLKTRAAGHLESDGRTAGGRAVVRLRDLSSHKRDLLEIVDRHRRFERDIKASRALLGALPHPVWMKDGAGRLSWVNEAYVKAVEASSEAEAIERQIELLDVRQRQSVDRALARGQPYRKRAPLTLGGERRAHDIFVIPIDGGAAAAAVEAAVPEPSRKDADRPTESHDRTLDRVATAVAIFNREQKLTVFNDAYLKLWRLDAAWLETGPAMGAVLDRLRDLGRLPEVVNYREWRDKVLSSYKAGAGHEDWWHLPDGRVLRVMAEQRPDGGVTVLHADETERLALERRFNALITVQGETLNSLKEGVAVFATDGRLKLHNAAFAAIWRLSPEALEGSPHIDEIIRACEREFGRIPVWASVGEAVTAFSERRGNLEGQMARTGGSVIDYAAAPLPDGAMLLIFADVTAAKQAERALIESNEALVLADRLKSQFIGHVSRELRTPLTHIIGFSELLSSPRAGPLNGKQREYVADITSSSKTLLSIIEDILDMATIDAGALELKPQRVEVRNVIEAAIQGVRERAARARLTLDIRVADDAVAFYADEQRVRQVLYHLLSNAIGFSMGGKVVRLTCWREKSKMIFAVEDEGVGIPKDQQSIVFERFESRSQGSRHRGAGLGLSIVKSVVELHGGDMELASESGRGTRVIVRFPENAPGRASEKPEKRMKPARPKTEKSDAA